MEAVTGPAPPAILHDTVGLSGAKLQQYSKHYDTYIASTKVARDSLRSNLQAIRSAYESGDRSATRDRRDTVMHLSQKLSRRDQEFEKSLKALLSSDQQKQYDQWNADRQKNERAKCRSEHQDHGRQDASSKDRSGTHWLRVYHLNRARFAWIYLRRTRCSGEEIRTSWRKPSDRNVART